LVTLSEVSVEFLTCGYFMQYSLNFVFPSPNLLRG
jgi:hypothetical protein